MSPSRSGDYVFAVTDYYSRYVKISILTRNTAKVAISSLSKMFATHGFPYTVTSDTSSHFCGRIVWNLLNGQRTKHRKTTPLWPRPMVRLKAKKRSLLKRMLKAQVEGKDWKEAVMKYLVASRNTPHQSTGVLIRAVVWREVGHKTSQSQWGCQSRWGSKGQRPRHKNSRWRSVRTKWVMPMKAIWWQVTSKQVDCPAWNSAVRAHWQEWQQCCDRVARGNLKIQYISEFVSWKRQVVKRNLCSWRKTTWNWSRNGTKW